MCDAGCIQQERIVFFHYINPLLTQRKDKINIRNSTDVLIQAMYCHWICYELNKLYN